MESNKELIYREAKKSDGLLATKQIEALGISRGKIRQLTESGLLVKETKGLYSVPEIAADEYATLQHRSDKLVFSYGTALFFHGMSDRVPRTIDATIPQGYNASRLKKTHSNLRLHYVKPEILMLGTEIASTPQGASVVVYNRERCICDLIKEQNKMEKQLYIQAIREYFAASFDPRTLLKMAKVLGVEPEVRTYMEVL